MNGTSIKCAVNPKLGYELEYKDYDLDVQRTHNSSYGWRACRHGSVKNISNKRI